MPSDQTTYHLAESMDERVAVGMAKFYKLWREVHGPEEMPDIQTCRKFIKPFVWKEALNFAHGELHRLQDEVTMKRDRNIARDIMLNNAEIEVMLKLERL